MTPSFITDEFSQDLQAAMTLAVRSGVARVELRSLWGKNCAHLDPGEVQRAAAMADLHGLAISGLDTFVFKGAWADKGRADGAALARRSLEVAAALKARFIRIFAFWRTDAPEPGAVADALRPVCELAATFGIEVLIENGTFSTVGEGSALARLLDLIDQRNAAALWDPGNVLNGGWAEGIDDGARALAHRIRHVHVKNPHSGVPGKLRYGALQGGMIDWPAHIALLSDLGYRGDLCLETHWRTGRSLIGRDALDFPEGEPFSAGGEEPTRSMLGELRATLAGVRGAQPDRELPVA